MVYSSILKNNENQGKDNIHCRDNTTLKIWLFMNFEYERSVNELYSDLLAPVQTIFPELKIRAVVLGSRILMMTAAKRYEKWREQ